MQLSVFGWGTGDDADVYVRYALEWLAGTASTASQVEYPPGAFPIFLIPLLVGSAATYRRVFAIAMMCVDLAACILVLKYAAASARRWLSPVGAAVVYMLATAALFPVLYARFDLVPATLVLAAVYCLRRERWTASGALLGAGAAVKLWPFALVPLLLASAARHGGRKHVAGPCPRPSAPPRRASRPPAPLP